MQTTIRIYGILNKFWNLINTKDSKFTGNLDKGTIMYNLHIFYRRDVILLSESLSCRDCAMTRTIPLIMNERPNKWIFAINHKDGCLMILFANLKHSWSIGLIMHCISFVSGLTKLPQAGDSFSVNIKVYIVIKYNDVL